MWIYQSKLGAALCVALVAAVGAEKWRWPEGAASVRIDTKVRFIDSEPPTKSNRDSRVQSDEVPFKEPTDTEGFYNRPPGSGRFPVRVEPHRLPYQVDGQAIYPLNKRPKNSDEEGTLDSLQYCKCLAKPDCEPRPESASACGYGMFLCCYTRPNQVNQQNTEFFNEVDDERPMLLPGRENIGRPFPPPSLNEPGGYFDFHGDPAIHQQGVLVGPDGPTGIVGPQGKPDVLVGPNGPTGIVGPKDDIRQSGSAQRGVLVGPGGPTGVIGPYGQRPVLVGPGGPTGIIGPRRTPGILTGPGGPTGIIGPAGYGRNPGVLVGPGGPTGVIGPGRPILVGPGGRTGRIGPPSAYFGCARTKRRKDKMMMSKKKQRCQ